MHIEEITTTRLSDVSDRELYSLRLRFIQLWSRNFAERDKDTDVTVGKLTRSQFLSKYRLLVSEIRSRRLKFNASEIDHALFGKRMSVHKLGFDTGALEETTLIPEFVSLVGSYVVDPEKAEDLDVLVRKNTRDESVEIKVSRALAQQIEKHCHYIYAPTGPHGSYVPLFDLVLKPRSEINKVIVKSGEHDQSYYKGLNEWSEEFVAEFAILLPYFNKGDKIIDLGCGSGRVLRMLKRLGFENLVGIDINEQALELCEKAGLEVKKVDLSKDKLPYNDQSFDVTVCTHVLEHVEDEVHLLNEAQRVAKLALFVVPLGKRECRGHKHEYEDISTIQEELGLDQSVISIEGTNSALIVLPMERITRGGEGSGFFGHAGRPGVVGGSVPGEGVVSFDESELETLHGYALDSPDYLTYKDWDHLTVGEKKHATEVDGLLRRLPEKPGVVYRGMSFSNKETFQDFWSKTVPGSKYQTRGIQAATNDLDSALTYTEVDYPVLLKITGKTCRDFSEHSLMADIDNNIREYAFLRGTNFTVHTRGRIEGVPLIELKEE